MEKEVNAVLNGNCIVYPTTTLPALGCILTSKSLDKLYSIKKKIVWCYQKYIFDPSVYWNKNGGEKYFNSFHTFQDRNENQFLEFIKKHKPKRIIDIGCGYGRYLKAIRNQFSDIELYGSDISSTQIAYAKKYLSNDNINLLISDSTKFDFQFAPATFSTPTCRMGLCFQLLPAREIGFQCPAVQKLEVQLLPAREFDFQFLPILNNL